MSLKINHNISHLKTLHDLQETNKNLGIVSERLASGVSAAAAVEGGAVLSLTEKLRADVLGLNQASQNTEAASSLIQIAEQSLVEVSEQIRHLRTIAVMAADGGLGNASTRQAIQEEVENALGTIDYLAANTTFGSKPLFDGSAAMKATALGDGFTFIEGLSTTDHELNKPQRIVIQASASRNTTLGKIDFADVLDRSEIITISENDLIATYAVKDGISVEENLDGLKNAILDAGINVAASLEGGAIRLTHHEFGGKRIFRVQSDTPGLLQGGDDENTEARIRQEIEEGLKTRKDVLDYLVDGIFVAIDVATGAGLASIIVKNTPAFKGLQEDLLTASKKGTQALKQASSDQNELLSTFEFIVPSKFNLSPQALIRLNQKVITDFSIASANRTAGFGSLSLGDLAIKQLGKIDVDRAIGDPNQSAAVKVRQVLGVLGDRMAEQLASETIKAIRFLLGKEASQNLVTPLLKGMPTLLGDLFNAGLSKIGNELPAQASNQAVFDFISANFPDFMDGEDIRAKIENTIGILNPLEPNSGVTPEDFKLAEGVDSAFINNGRDVIGFFENEKGVGDGAIIRGTRKFADIAIRYDGDLDPGDQAEGSIIIKDPGLIFQIGNLAQHQALFGLPNISTFELARDVRNGSAYSSLADIDFSTQDGASDAIPVLNAANEQILLLRGSLGIFGSALNSNVTTLQNLADGAADGESQIGGTDIAIESANLLKQQILSNAQGVAFAHGNITPKHVLSLLKGQ